MEEAIRGVVLQEAGTAKRRISLEEMRKNGELGLS
jgi:hypothetical protein